MIAFGYFLDDSFAGVAPLLLPTGTQIPLANLTFDAGTQRFFYGSLDVTQYMSPNQKLAFVPQGFDETLANSQASVTAHPYTASEGGTTDVSTLFWGGVSDTISTAASTANKAVNATSSNLGLILLTVAILGGGYYVSKLAPAPKRK